MLSCVRSFRIVEGSIIRLRITRELEPVTCHMSLQLQLKKNMMARFRPGGSPGVSRFEPGPASGPGLSCPGWRADWRAKSSGLAPSAMYFLSLWERVRAYYHTITAPLSKPYRGAETELWCGPHKRKKFEGKKKLHKPHI